MESDYPTAIKGSLTQIHSTPKTTIHQYYSETWKNKKSLYNELVCAHGMVVEVSGAAVGSEQRVLDYLIRITQLVL